MNRDFKGVWIPKPIWLCEELNVQEKVLLVEINSLDNEDGCFASNEHFADFLGISKTQVSKYITKLEDKGFVTRESFDGRKRVLRSNLEIAISGDDDTPLRKLKGSLKEKERQPTRKGKGGNPASQGEKGDEGQKNRSSSTSSSTTSSLEQSSIMQRLSSDDPSDLNANDLIKLFNHYMSTIAEFERTTTNWGKEGKIMKRLSQDYMDGPEMAVDYLKWIARNKADAFEHTKNSWNNAGMLNKFIDEYKNWKKKKEKSERLAKQIDAGAPDVDESVNSMEEVRNLMR